jgi:hypothetical protein
MADKLEWMNRHLVLVRYTTVKDVVAGENYKIRPDLANLFEGVSGTEAMVFKFAAQGNYKEACELLVYIAHRRAGIWWGYRCALSLMEEMLVNPSGERDIADIAKEFEVTVPDFAKVSLPEPPDMSEMNAIFAKLKPETQAMRKKADPVVMKLVDDAMKVAFGEFEKVHGIHPLKLVEQLCARLAQDPLPIDPASPVFTAQAELRAKLQAVQKETVETIKSVLPPKVPAHQKKLSDNALAAAYRWVAAPNAENAQRCLDVGNECPDQPGGLLSLSAFWSFGNLMPTGEQVISTPAGLAANGLVQTLLLCALAPGGVRKAKERYAEYFRLGVEVLTGADNWEASLAEGRMPHEKIPSPDWSKAQDKTVAEWQDEEGIAGLEAEEKEKVIRGKIAEILAGNRADFRMENGSDYGTGSAPPQGAPDGYKPKGTPPPLPPPVYKRWKPE